MRMKTESDASPSTITSRPLGTLLRTPWSVIHSTS